MSKYINLSRIEFVVTNACRGQCRHCSVSDRLENNDNGSINCCSAVDTVQKLAKKFEVKSILTFGGEALLHPDTVCKIHSVARECEIPERQLITSGYFPSKNNKINDEKIADVAKAIYYAGVNNVLLSVDAFHQEFIPVEYVLKFAKALRNYEFLSFKVHPSWVINKYYDNDYNSKTKQLLEVFTDMEIEVSEGKIITPSGKAEKNLAEYFPLPEQVDFSIPCGSSLHTSKPDKLECISIKPNGKVYACSSIGNIYEDDIVNIINSYDPYNIPWLNAVLNGGVPQLIDYVKNKNLGFDISDSRSACAACRKIMDALQNDIHSIEKNSPHAQSPISRKQ